MSGPHREVDPGGKLRVTLVKRKAYLQLKPRRRPHLRCERQKVRQRG